MIVIIKKKIRAWLNKAKIKKYYYNIIKKKTLNIKTKAESRVMSKKQQ